MFLTWVQESAHRATTLSVDSRCTTVKAGVAHLQDTLTLTGITPPPPKSIAQQILRMSF